MDKRKTTIYKTLQIIMAEMEHLLNRWVNK